MMILRCTSLIVMMVMVLLVLLVLLAQGCEDESKQPFQIPPDGSPPVDVGVPFLTSCEKDDDCLSGHCITIGGATRCSRTCGPSSPCPPFPEWSCNSQSVCECNGAGKQPDICNTDGDCDGQPDRPPSAETCNDEDDDCNGTVDDVAPNTPGSTKAFQDADGDGYGDDTVVRWLCAPTDGWVTSGGDCNDTREGDHPGAEEICDDTFDNDCNGDADDTDICGLPPLPVSDVHGGDFSGELTSCAPTPAVDASLDIVQIVAKQDPTAIKFTVRLAGLPALSTCSSYTLRFGDPKKTTDEVVYIFRPATTACGALPAKEAYLQGQSMATSVETSFNASAPGNVAFIINKTEIFPHLPIPTYRLTACSNAQSNPAQDPITCSSDSCKTPVHR